MHSPSPNVIKALEVLHPEAAAPQLSVSPQIDAPVVEEEAVSKALLSFKPDSSAGASALSAQHLKDAVACGCPTFSERASTQLTKVANVCVAGEVPAVIAPYRCRAPLMPLKKDDGGVRPSDRRN